MLTRDTGTDELLCSIDQGVAIITLNRPKARNALSPALTVALRETIAWAGADAAIGAVLITGAGQAFCAGGDVKAMNQRTTSTEQPTMESRFREMRDRHHEVTGALRKMRKPTIAAIPGAAFGAGLAITLACDFRLAARSALLSTAYAKIALPGDYGISWLLTRVVGPGRARELMLTADRISAERAEVIGLVSRVVDDELLATEAFALARQLAQGPQTAYAYMKDSLDEAFMVDHYTAINSEADRLLKAQSTADHREAVKAFAEKREPVFTGTLPH